MIARLLSWGAGFLGGWQIKAALAALVALGLAAGWLYVRHLQATIAEQRVEIEARDGTIARLGNELTAAADAADANRQALEAATRAHAETVAALERAAAEADARAADLATIKTEIYRAPQTDDGPVAPVLARTLDRLRQLSAGGAEGGGAD